MVRMCAVGDPEDECGFITCGVVERSSVSGPGGERWCDEAVDVIADNVTEGEQYAPSPDDSMKDTIRKCRACVNDFRVPLNVREVSQSFLDTYASCCEAVRRKELEAGQ